VASEPFHHRGPGRLISRQLRSLAALVAKDKTFWHI
jgi:hypothetical protein